MCSFNIMCNNIRGNMDNFVIVFDVKIIYMMISSNHASFMNFGKKIG